MEASHVNEESETKDAWKIDPATSDPLTQRTDVAFNVALGKFLDTGGNTETVVQTGEAFGRGLFADFLQEDQRDWTLHEWLNITAHQIFSPMGSGFTFTELSEDTAILVMTKSPLHEQSQGSPIASLFTYGFIRSLFLSAFPKGEVFLGSTVISNVVKGDTMTEFVAVTNASDEDRWERERVKQYFTKMKKG